MSKYNQRNLISQNIVFRKAPEHIYSYYGSSRRAVCKKIKAEHKKVRNIEKITYGEGGQTPKWVPILIILGILAAGIGYGVSRYLSEEEFKRREEEFKQRVKILEEKAGYTKSEAIEFNKIPEYRAQPLDNDGITFAKMRKVNPEIADSLYRTGGSFSKAVNGDPDRDLIKSSDEMLVTKTDPLKFDFFRVDFKPDSEDPYSTPETLDDVQLISHEELRRRAEAELYDKFFPVPDELIKIIDNKMSKMHPDNQNILDIAESIAKEVIAYTQRENKYTCLLVARYNSALMNKTFRAFDLNAHAWMCASGVEGVEHSETLLYDKNLRQVYVIWFADGEAVPFKEGVFPFSVLYFDNAAKRWGIAGTKEVIIYNLMDALYFDSGRGTACATLTNEHARWLANYMRTYGFDNKLYEEARRIQSINDSRLVSPIKYIENRKPPNPLEKKLVVSGEDDPFYFIVNYEIWEHVYDGKEYRFKLEN
jgi:hypothetical protein